MTTEVKKVKKETVAERLKSKEGEVIKLDEKVIVKGAKDAKYLVEGKKYKVHPILAEKLIKQKQAVK